MMIETKVNKLNNIIKEDNRFYFSQDVDMDYTFAKIGDEVTVSRAFLDSGFPSDVGLHIKFKNSGKEFDIDSDLLISRKNWVDLFNSITRSIDRMLNMTY